MNEKLINYLLTTIQPKDPLIRRLEQDAKEDHVPIMDPIGIELLLQLIRVQKPDKILEIGTAIGYSAIRMAQSHPKTYVVTIERDEARAEEAIENMKQADLTDRIKLIIGDALEVEEEVRESAPFDFVFIDAAKGQYQQFFKIYAKYIPSGGMVVSDNVLFKGYVSGEASGNQRLEKIGDKIRSYNEWLIKHPDFYTTIVPVGDGIAISVKR
ncbi:MAG: O-methyltransferase [Bacillaceae bacterium]|nr:O-methyltransferase [Bacillaceae bacterium]